MPEPQPFGHDPKRPPWEEIESEPAEPVRDLPPSDEPIVAVRRVFRNVVRLDQFPLQLTATETLVDGDQEADREAAERRLLCLVDSLQVYYADFSLSQAALPPGVDFGAGDEPMQEEEADIKAPFEGIFDLEEGAQRLVTFELFLPDLDPRSPHPDLAIGATIDPIIYSGDLHGYIAKCTTSAWASAVVYAGRVRVRAYRNGQDLGAAEAGAGETSKPVGRNTATRSTFDTAVRGLGATTPRRARSDYAMRMGWKPGPGGGC
jgi:hypothetical protein